MMQCKKCPDTQQEIKVVKKRQAFLFAIFAILIAGCATSNLPVTAPNGAPQGYFVRFYNSRVIEELFEELTGLDMEPEPFPYLRGVNYCRDVSGETLFIVGRELNNNRYNILGSIVIKNGILEEMILCNAAPTSRTLVQSTHSAYGIQRALQQIGSSYCIKPDMDGALRTAPSGRILGDYILARRSAEQYNLYSFPLSRPLVALSEDTLAFPLEFNGFRDRPVLFETQKDILITFGAWRGQPDNVFTVFRTSKDNPAIPSLWLSPRAPGTLMGWLQGGCGGCRVTEVDESGRYLIVDHYRDLPLLSYDYIYDTEKKTYKYLGTRAGTIYLRFPLPKAAHLREEAKGLALVESKDGILIYRKTKSH